MRFSFSVLETLSRFFLISEFDHSLPGAHLARALTGRANAFSAGGVIFYECERTRLGDCLVGASYYRASGEEAPLSADGARALAAFLLKKDASLPSCLRILSMGEIKSVTEEHDGKRRLFCVKVPPPSYEARQVGLRASAPLLGQRIPIGAKSIPVYALALGIPHAVILDFGTSLEGLRPASIALPLSVKPLFLRPFCTVFAEQTASDTFGVRIFDSEHGELDGSSEGAGAAASIFYLLGLCPTAQPLRAVMRGGILSIHTDHLGAPLSLTAEVRECFEGVAEI